MTNLRDTFTSFRTSTTESLLVRHVIKWSFLDNKRKSEIEPTAVNTEEERKLRGIGRHVFLLAVALSVLIHHPWSLSGNSEPMQSGKILPMMEIINQHTTNEPTSQPAYVQCNTHTRLIRCTQWYTFGYPIDINITY